MKLSVLGCVVALTCILAPVAGTSQASGPQSNSSKASHAAAAKKPASRPSAQARKPAVKSARSTATHSRSGATSSAHGKSKAIASRRSGKKRTTARGQQKIDSERADQIQEALIRAHYLNGEATGSWNAETESALRRYQEDHGWQTKTVPDARALISLGLGPNQDHLLNPQTAMTSGPNPPVTTPLIPVSHSADPSASAPLPAAAGSSAAPDPPVSVPAQAADPQD